MSPNCRACDDGGHDHCTGGYCECGKRGHSPLSPAYVDQQTGDRIPNYAVLDLWMALGYEPGHEFDDQIAMNGTVDTYARLLSEVRALNDRGRLEATVSKAEASVATQPDPPLMVRAHTTLDEFVDVTGVDVEYDYDEQVTDYGGRTVHGIVGATLHITGTVR